MKKTLILLFLLCFGAWSQAKAQNVIFQEDFEGQVLIESGTAINPTGGWQSINLSTSTDGWRTATESQINAGTGGAVGNAGYRFFGKDMEDRFIATNDDKCQAGACDKRQEILISPEIELPTGRVYISYDAFFLGIRYQDGTQEACSLVVTTNNGQSWINVAAVPVTSWGKAYTDLSAFAGRSIRFGFRYEDKGRAMLGCGVDNIELFVPLENNVMTTGIGSATTVQVGEEFVIRAGVYNLGTEPIKQLEIRWRSPGGVWVSDVLENLNIRPLTGGVVEHRIKAVLSEPGINEMDFDIAQVNTGPIADRSAVARFWNVNALRSSSIRRPLLEDYTGAWCGWCPRGHYYMECALEQYPQAIGIAVHWGNDQSRDGMVIPDGVSLIQDLRISGFPSFTVDRALLPGENTFAISQQAWWDAVKTRLAMPTPAHARIINRTYNPDTRELEATVEATFHSSTGTPAKLNLMIVEDEVVGSGVGFDQANYMNGTRTGNEYRTPCNGGSTTNPFFGKGDRIVGYKHKHTLRAMVGGARGMGNINPEAGGTYTQTFRTTLQQGWDPNKVSLVGIVQGGDPDNVVLRDVYNADEVKLLEDYMDAGPSMVIACKSSVELNPYTSFSQDGATFSWTPATGLSDANIAKPTANPTQTTTYTLTVTKDGKTHVDSLRIRVLPLVNFIPQRTRVGVGEEVNFLNVTTELGAYSYNWEFEPGKNSTDVNGKFTFDSPGQKTIKLTATKGNDQCGETVTKTITIFPTSREQTPVFTDVRVYPNPTQGNIYLQSDVNRTLELKVFNLQGQVVFRSSVPANANNFEVSLDNLTGGIYMMQLTDGQSIRTEKIVKQD